MGKLAHSFVSAVKELLIRDTVRETAAVWVTLAYLCFQLYRTFLNPLPPLILRPIHVTLMCLLCYLSVPVDKESSLLKKIINTGLEWLSILSTPFLLWYAVTQYSRLNSRISYLDPVQLIDHIACILLVVLILGIIWRTIGKVLAIFIMIFIAYVWVAPYLPGVLHYDGMSLDKFTDLIIMGTNGIFGSATSASSTFVFWVMIFGTLFATTGGGDVLIDIGIKAGARSNDNSGPAKAAVVASGLMGMISGSAAANVSGTGTITIPMMKKAGYTPESAGAIESVASTGGQIMPPIMGTSAFIMAEMLGISYGKIATSAIIPAAVYYISVFILVTLMAKKSVRNGQRVEMPPIKEKILPRLYLLAPVVVMVAVLGMGFTIQRAAIYAIGTVLVLNVISPKMRHSPKKVVAEFLNATRRTGTVAIPVSGCGIIIAVVSITGLATRISNLIFEVGSVNILLGCLITMVGVMLLGMALPTVAAYLTAFVLFVPTLRALGIDNLAANMFILYFGVFAQITPPVCVASYTAAGIAGADSWKTGWTAFSYSIVAFLAPFMFVVKTGLLLQGSIMDIVSATAILMVGTIFLDIGVAGYLKTPMKRVERILFVASGFITCLPIEHSDPIGIAMGIVLVVLHIIRWRASEKKDTPQIA
jgi:TRAP transporter 4TM/12TM fusion protein|nr:TRAP transporter fused permease subunit [uncultured Oscillibacter sp.]